MLAEICPPQTVSVCWLVGAVSSIWVSTESQGMKIDRR